MDPPQSAGDGDPVPPPPSPTSTGTARLRQRAALAELPGARVEIELEEIQSATIASDGRLLESEIGGELRIRNTAENDRVWDLDLALAGSEITDLERTEFHYLELDGGSDPVVTPYSVRHGSADLQMIAVREHMTTTSGSTNHSMVMGRDSDMVRFRLEVENLRDHPIQHVFVTRSLPEVLHHPEPSPTNIGTASIEQESSRTERTLVWNIHKLAARATAEFSFTAEVTPSQLAPIDVGALEVVYEARQSLSGLALTSFDAYCRAFTMMQVEEMERPNQWDVQVEFRNRSEFLVDLVKVEVSDMDGQKVLALEDVAQDIHPYDSSNPHSQTHSWSAQLAQQHLPWLSESRPAFNHEIVYSVVPAVSTVTRGQLSMEPRQLTVLAASVEKSFDTGILRQFSRATVEVHLVVRNEGSAPLNEIQIHDDIPGILAMPAEEDIHFIIGGEEFIGGIPGRIIISTTPDSVQEADPQWRTGTEAFDAEHAPPSVGGILHITLHDMEDWCGKLEQDRPIVIAYSTTAADPAPGQQVRAPTHVTAQSEPSGPVFETEVMAPPTLVVRSIRRKFKQGKYMGRIGAPGSYEIVLHYENTGDVILKDVVLDDWIPAALDVDGFSHEPAVEEVVGDLLHLQWKLGDLHPPDNLLDEPHLIEVMYEFHGDPEDPDFHPASARTFHGTPGPLDDLPGHEDFKTGAEEE